MIGLDGAAPLRNGNALDHVFQFGQDTRQEVHHWLLGPAFRDEQVSTGW
jgi:hypothetical protein